MNKQAYIKPAMRVVELQHQYHILAGSNFSTLGTNLIDDDELEYLGGGAYDAR